MGRDGRGLLLLLLWLCEVGAEGRGCLARLRGSFRVPVRSLRPAGHPSDRIGQVVTALVVLQRSVPLRKVALRPRSVRETSEGLGKNGCRKRLNSPSLLSAEICGSAALRTDASVLLIVPRCSFVHLSKELIS